MSQNRYVQVFVNSESGEYLPYQVRVHTLENSQIMEDVPVFGEFKETPDHFVISNSRYSHFLPKEAKNRKIRVITQEEHEALEETLFTDRPLIVQ